MKAYSAEDGFDNTRVALERLLKTVKAPENARMTHEQTESMIERGGCEVLRQLMQDFMDLQSAQEKRLEPIEGADGATRTGFRAECRRGLMTLFGEITATRFAYIAAGLSGFSPMDGVWNMTADCYSHGIHRRVAEEAAKASFDAAVKSIVRTTGGRIPKRQAEEVAVRSSQDFDAFYAGRRFLADGAADELLILTADMKGIVVKHEDLRPATRRAAERKPRSKLDKRLSAGEKRDRKRMAVVGAVYTVGRHMRTAEQLMYAPWAVGLETAPTPPRPRDKRVFATLAHTPEEAVEEIFREAFRRDPEQRRKWVMLIDGDEHQIARIERCAERFGVSGLTVVQDFIHVLEYLWKAAYAFHPAGSQEAQDWVTERGLRILQGRSSDVAAGIRRSATLRGVTSPAARKAVDKCADYLIKNRPRLRYDVALENGYPIATGVIEGACRHLVKDRMDITGARWTIRGAEAVLRLRALESSGDFDDYWNFHLAQEYERNHRALYAHPDLILKAA